MQAGTPRHPDLPPGVQGTWLTVLCKGAVQFWCRRCQKLERPFFGHVLAHDQGNLGGGGYYRNSKTPSYAGVGQIEPATWKRPTWSYFRFFFRRYLRPKGANTAKTQRFWVPSRLLFMEVRKPICGAFFFLRKQQKSSVTPNKTTSSNNILLQIVPYF